MGRILSARRLQDEDIGNHRMMSRARAEFAAAVAGFLPFVRRGWIRR